MTTINPITRQCVECGEVPVHGPWCPHGCGARFTCDICDREFTHQFRHEARTARPSDPSDMACVMWTCPFCAPSVGAWRPEVWDDWIENEGRALGYVFLS